jgi:hypothetical protein
MRRGTHSGNHHQSSTRSNGKSGHAANGKNGGGAQTLRHKSLHTQDSEGTRGAKIGVVEYFSLGDKQSVETVLAELRALKVADLRTVVRGRISTLTQVRRGTAGCCRGSPPR